MAAIGGVTNPALEKSRLRTVAPAVWLIAHWGDMMAPMNSALKKLLPAIETWPDEDQEALAEAAREIEALRTGVYTMSPDEEAAVAEGLLQADRNKFADDNRIRALWKRAGI